MTRTKKNGNLWLALALLILLAGPSEAADDASFAREMKAALEIHDQAESVSEEIRALDAFRGLTKRHEDAWQPAYWAAYLATQVARLEGRVDDFPAELDPKDLIREALEHSQQAKSRAADPSAELASDLAVLEGFIYQFFSSIVAESDEEKEQWNDRRRGAYDRALHLNPRNPLMYVLTGISFFGEGRRPAEVAAGIGLLDQAEQIFERAPNRALTTYFNKDFIPFWRARGQERLAELLGEK